jgi:signal transduction histidine kinase
MNLRIVVICLLFFFSCSANAQEVAVVPHPSKLVNLAQKATFLRDEKGLLPIGELLHNSDSLRFSPIDGDVVSFGITQDVFWLKVNLRNETRKNLLLKIGNNALSQVDVFEAVNGKIMQQFHSNVRQPFASRPVKDVDLVFPLQAPLHVTESVYIRVQHNRGTRFYLLTGTETAFYNEASTRNVLQGMYFGLMLLMMLYNLFIYFSLKDSSYLYYVLYIFLMGLFNASVSGYGFQFLWPRWPLVNEYEDLLSAFVCISGILFTMNFLNTKRTVPFFHAMLLCFLAALIIITGLVVAGFFVLASLAVEIASLLLALLFFATAYRALRNGYKPARFFLLAWSLLLVCVIIFVLKDFNLLPKNAFTDNALQIGSAAEALLLSLALANKINVYKHEKQEAQLAALQSLEENRKLITEQNVLLEKKVAERTGELTRSNNDLSAALQNLQQTQAQLVQREKMASLGELTAGIAHEIQNPLNFVNNFAECNAELLAELKDEILAGNEEQAVALAKNLLENEERILHHGKRADSIVRSMLQHTTNSGGKETIDLNAITEEYLRISYLGVRSRDKDFQVHLVTKFDKGISEISAAPQELGRVLLNLYNNAFYAVQEKKKQLDGSFEPTVSVTTVRAGRRVEIRVKDNGTGIPPQVLEKIFQPFFTTKPTGEGTGLGLSLSYDIITKGHAGELSVESKEGEGAEFTIQLPVINN